MPSVVVTTNVGQYQTGVSKTRQNYYYLYYFQPTTCVFEFAYHLIIYQHYLWLTLFSEANWAERLQTLATNHYRRWNLSTRTNTNTHTSVWHKSKKCASKRILKRESINCCHWLSSYLLICNIINIMKFRSAGDLSFNLTVVILIPFFSGLAHRVCVNVFFCWSTRQAHTEMCHTRSYWTISSRWDCHHLPRLLLLFFTSIHQKPPTTTTTTSAQVISIGAHCMNGTYSSYTATANSNCKYILGVVLQYDTEKVMVMVLLMPPLYLFASIINQSALVNQFNLNMCLVRQIVLLVLMNAFECSIHKQPFSISCFFSLIPFNRFFFVSATVCSLSMHTVVVKFNSQ